MGKITEKEVVEVLMQCFDPEIPIDLWNLGLIYSIQISQNSNGNYNVHIIMTLTTPGCTMGNVMSGDIKSKLEDNPFIDEAIVEVTFDPPWSPDLMSDFAREKLGFPPKNEKSNEINEEETQWE